MQERRMRSPSKFRKQQEAKPEHKKNTTNTYKNTTKNVSRS